MIIAMLPDQKRLHLQHGPIGLVVEAFGTTVEIAKAYRAAGQRFETVLDELVTELPLLRATLLAAHLLEGEQPTGKVAKAMFAAVTPHASEFITPMAAVAGAVADEILATMLAHARLDKAYVNNGGDIALYLNPEANMNFRAGVVSDPRTGKLVTTATITADAGIKGIATSGWHGRSHSLGIADSVTVFANSAAIADAAATIIANHVDISDGPKIIRQLANQMSPDSDLGSQPVTVSVGNLTACEIEQALAAGELKAAKLCNSGLIIAAFICLQGRAKIIHWPTGLSSEFIPQAAVLPLQHRNCHA